MANEFNLLVSCPRGKEAMAKAEASAFLSDLGDTSPAIWRTRFSGLLYGRTSLDPFDVVRKARQEALENPWEFRYVTKLVPVGSTCKASTQDLVATAARLRDQISRCRTFRITLSKRGCDLTADQVISSIAPLFSTKVDLENPECVLLIEVIGQEAGISVITEPVFSLQRCVNGNEKLIKIRS